MSTITGWASTGTTQLTKWSYHPRPLGKNDIDIEISHCGICGTDIHTLKGELGPLTNPPCIVGHEIVGKVIARGADALFQVGERVAVGAMVDACLGCEACKNDMNPQCKKMAFTYNDVYKTDGKSGVVTYGGYADRVIVPSQFAYHIPDVISSAEAAPLLCAGITTYAPIARFGAGPNKSVGVFGIGGLGHLAIQWAAAFKSKEVYAISTSDNKREEAKKLGATKFINSRKKEDTDTLASKIDLLIVSSYGPDTNYNELLSWVADNGTAVMLAVPEEPMKISAQSLIYRNVSLTGSLIGGRKITQEMLEFAAKHNVRPWIEKMPMSDPNAAVKHMIEGRPHYRIVMETGK